MDQKLQAYIDSLVLEVLQAPSLSGLTDEQKKEYTFKVQDHFNNVIFDTTVDLMSPEQLISIKDIPMDSPQMLQKIEEISSEIPLLSQKLEERLRQTVETLKNNPQMIT